MNPERPLPPALAARPFDAKRGVPVPFVSEHDADGRVVVDFVGINAGRALLCAQERLCGLCGQPLAYWIAFLGGPGSALARSYGDPPMHEACAEAALQLCPHIAIRHHQRAPEHRLATPSSKPTGWVEEKPSRWVVGVTRDFRWHISGGFLLFFPAPFKRVRTFAYYDDFLVEVRQ